MVHDLVAAWHRGASLCQEFQLQYLNLVHALLRGQPIPVKAALAQVGLMEKITVYLVETMSIAEVLEKRYEKGWSLMLPVQ